MKTTLYDILESHRAALEAWIEDSETPDECWADTVDGIEGEFESKARSYAAVIKELESLADMKKAAAKKISDGAKTLESRADFLRERLKFGMESTGITKIPFAEFTISIPKPRASLKVDDAILVPDRFCVVETVRNLKNADIKAALEAGEEVLGAHLDYKTSITIR